ncbi:MAG: hypothetical protein IT436_06185 [Phycisphaerales bacterium]|nr:hypothetical protein [Phycisphaerales bacterium]
MLAELERQLRFAPADALRRHLERVEAMAGEIDAEGKYPEDWVAFRVTGYRPPASGHAVVTGEALLGDISALAERLSDAAGVTWVEARERDRALDADEVCARWSISRKTLERYRRRGLPARRVSVEKGLSKLAFLPEVVGRFERTHELNLKRAASFTRIDARTRARMLRRAVRYRRKFDCSLNQVAARLAERFDRSHEAVRQLLRRQPRTGPGPAFDRREPLRERQRRVILRAWRRGLEASDLAAWFGVSRGAVLRALNVERARLLRGLLETALATVPSPPLFERADADDVLLSAPSVREGLAPPPVTDLLEWIEAARVREVVGPAEEQTRLAAYQFLRHRAARAAQGLNLSHPSGSALDEAETRLRWAGLLKALIVRSQFALLVETCEGRLARPLEDMRAADLAPLLHGAVTAIGLALDHHDHTKGGRLAAAAGLAVDRFTARWLRDHAPGVSMTHRATPRLRTGLPFSDWTIGLCAWRAWLDPDPRLRSASKAIEPGLARILAMRFGWTGGPPVSQKQLSMMLGVPLVHAARMERKALRAALTLARAGGAGT